MSSERHLDDLNIFAKIYPFVVLMCYTNNTRYGMKLSGKENIIVTDKKLEIASQFVLSLTTVCQFIVIEFIILIVIRHILK